MCGILRVPGEKQSEISIFHKTHLSSLFPLVEGPARGWDNVWEEVHSFQHVLEPGTCLEFPLAGPIQVQLQRNVFWVGHRRNCSNRLCLFLRTAHLEPERGWVPKPSLRGNWGQRAAMVTGPACPCLCNVPAGCICLSDKNLPSAEKSLYFEQSLVNVSAHLKSWGRCCGYLSGTTI